MISVLRHRGLRRNDVMIASYPRSGNTWLRFLLYEAITGQQATFPSLQAIPYLGDHHGAPELLPGGGRLLKTHERYHHVYRKAIYLIRDPRDVVLSDFKYARMGRLFSDDLERFVDDFVEGRVHAFGSWADHVCSWLDSPIAAQDGLLVVKYEDMRRDPVWELDKILRFLGVERPVGRLRTVVENNTVERMRQKEEEQRLRGVRSPGFRFVDRGRVGVWEEELSQGQLAKILAHASSARRILE